MTRFRGRVWRHVPPGAEPLHLGWILRAARGRWNLRRPRLPCLYTSLTPEGAIAELQKHTSEYLAPLRRDLVSLEVDVAPVLDLTSERVRTRLGVALPDLTGDRTADLAACRALARRHVLHGTFRAILAPSASLPGAANLMIYVESTGGIRLLTNGPDRVALTPGFRWPP